MAIWLDELERETRVQAEQTLLDRRSLRNALTLRHEALQDDPEADSVLLIVDALPRPAAPDAVAELAPVSLTEGQALLHTELARLPCEAFALRHGQSCLLLPGSMQTEDVKLLLSKLNRRLQTTGRKRFKVVFGMARAREARLGGAAWLALADLRFQVFTAQAGLPSVPRSAPRPAPLERRRTGKR